MAYDSGIASFTTKTNKVDLVDAAHINAVQTELVTIETILGTNVKGDRADLKTRLNNQLDADGTILSGTSYPSPGLTSQLFWRTDAGALYIFTGSSWQTIASSLSNVLFQYQAIVDAAQEAANASLTPATPTVTYRYLSTNFASSDHYIASTKWTKISGVNTIIVYAQIWVQSAGQAKFIVNVGGVTGSVLGTNNQTSPEWKFVSLNVSALVNGTTYDITYGTNHDSLSAKQFIGSVIGFGS